MLAKASSGSPKNITPIRLTVRSNDAGSNGWLVASPWTKVAFVMPASAVRNRALSSIRADTSIPNAEPALASRAASRVVWPFPQPMSRIRSAARMAAASSSRW